jgi:hypothetical protein
MVVGEVGSACIPDLLRSVVLYRFTALPLYRFTALPFRRFDASTLQRVNASPPFPASQIHLPRRPLRWQGIISPLRQPRCRNPNHANLG